MAKKTAPKQAALPQGYEELSGKPAGYFVRKIGNTIEGKYRGSFESKNGKFGPRLVHQIEITDGATLVEMDKEEMDASEGVTVAINETGYLKALRKVEDGQRVFIRCAAKGPDQKDPWIFQIGVARA